MTSIIIERDIARFLKYLLRFFAKNILIHIVNLIIVYYKLL